ncbi:MAG: helix-turn-helix domain-containing protein [bacterium]
MSEAGFYMSKKEVDRLLVLKDLRSKKINQIEASRLLGITDRHVRRLVKSYVMEGKSGLVSKKRGVVSNNKISDRDRAMMMLIVSGHYYDFGPTLACEKLREVHDLHVSRETLRKWMIEDGIWKPLCANIDVVSTGEERHEVFKFDQTRNSEKNFRS